MKSLIRSWYAELRPSEDVEREKEGERGNRCQKISGRKEEAEEFPGSREAVFTDQHRHVSASALDLSGIFGHLIEIFMSYLQGDPSA